MDSETQSPEITRLWDGDAPNALGADECDIPAMSFYESRMNVARGAIVICAGGGYARRSEHEGDGFARWLSENGYHCFVLNYRVGTDGYRHPAMIEDARRALRIVRHMAPGLGVSPERVAIMGSSAGGHLAAHLSTAWDTGDREADDIAERESCRPDLCILCYPVITMLDPFANKGSRSNLLGDNFTDAQCRELSPHLNVNAETPPCFIWHCYDDAAVPVENSLDLAAALRSREVPFELHLYQTGGHGKGRGVHPTWQEALLVWLSERWPAN